MIKGLQNVYIRTSNVKKLASFYREALKLAVRHSNAESVVFELGKQQALVIHKGRDEGVARPVMTLYSSCGFGLLVDDVDAFYEKHKSQVQFPKPPADEDGGARTVTAFDPEGNKIDFIEDRSKAKS